MYRPQFAYNPPDPPCHSQKCQYSFDQTNLPALTGSLAANGQTGRIPLKLDKDAPFILRGIVSQGALSFRLEDKDGNGLSDSENAVNSTNFELPKEYANPAGAGLVALEGEVYAPIGGTIVLTLLNNTSGSVNLNTFAINLHGEKRYQGEACQ